MDVISIQNRLPEKVRNYIFLNGDKVRTVKFRKLATNPLSKLIKHKNCKLLSLYFKFF